MSLRIGRLVDGPWGVGPILRGAIAVERSFAPALGQAERERELGGWGAAVAAVRTMARGAATRYRAAGKGCGPL